MPRKKGYAVPKRQRGLPPLLAVTHREKGPVSIRSQVSAFDIVDLFQKYFLCMCYIPRH